MRLHPQRVVQGGHLRHGIALGATSDPALPPDRSKQARDLAWGNALTPQGRPTRRAGGPGGRPAGPFGEHSFDQVDREDAGDLPRRQHQRGA